MTTLVSLASRDFIVVGCDSLATQSARLIDPNYFISQFFDQTTGELLRDANNQPLLSNELKVWQSSARYPVNQLPSVTKIFDLAPAKAALLFSGAARIKDLTVRNLVESFKETDEFGELIGRDYEMPELAQTFKEFMVSQYIQQYPNEQDRPLMDIILSGYSCKCRQPQVFRLTFEYNWQTSTFMAEILEECSKGNYHLVYGGQYDVIERVVGGLDISSFFSLRSKCEKILRDYRAEIQDQIHSAGIQFDIPDLDPSQGRYSLFHGDLGGVTGLSLDIGGLSEQAGIDFVTFLIKTMIHAQEFATSIPTVGGEVHLGIITPNDGFKWLSKEEYKFEGNSVLKYSKP